MDEIGDFGHLVHCHLVRSAADVEQDVACTEDVVVVEQWRCQSAGHSLRSAVGARCRCRSHDGHTRVGHHSADVLKVNVHVTFHSDDLGNAFGGNGQDVVRLVECLAQFQVAVHLAQLVVADDEHGVHMLLQFVQTKVGLHFPFLSFKCERHSDDAHSEDAHFASGLSDNRCSTSTRATAHTSGDEHHLGIVAQHFFDLVKGFDGGIATHFGLGSCTTTFRKARPKGDLLRHRAHVERLLVRVADHEVHSADALSIHVVDSIRAATTNSDHFDDGAFFFGKIEIHDSLCHGRRYLMVKDLVILLCEIPFTRRVLSNGLCETGVVKRCFSIVKN